MKRQRKLEKHPNGQYRIRICRNGVTKSFFLGRNEKKARKEANRVEQDVAAGKISFTSFETSAVQSEDGKKDIRLEELIVMHLEWVKANRAKATFELRQRYLLEFLNFIGPCMVSDITRMKLEDYYRSVRIKGGKPNSGNHQMREVKTLLLWGEEMEVIDLPFRKFPKVRHTPPETKRVSEGDLIKLFSVLPEDFKDMITFGLLTGLRPQELRELTQDQIRIGDGGKAYLYIEGHKISKMVRDPKPRSVPLSSEANGIVQRQVQKHPKESFIFLNDHGKPYTRTVYRNRLIRWCRKAGIKETTPYALRHTFASMESDAGVETNSLASLMGHSETRTLKRYVTNSFECHMDAVEKVEARLKKAVGE